ncbi:DUF6344 domain-containing protein [Streptomyces inhibens]|uniref:DUF6344 domain-containing protein n=1 Tax=Streptomyces inhibens TaxID=2293571 RepID=UPI0036B9E292
MAATKVMKFWAVCLAMLGKLLASLGVSAAASAARRDAALYERTLGNGNAGTEGPGADAREAVRRAEPDPDAEAPTRAVPPARTVPAPRGVPQYGQSASVRRMFARPELPPTIKQRISAEAHGSSPGLRSRRARATEPLHTCADEDTRPAVIPAARRRADTARAF